MFLVISSIHCLNVVRRIRIFQILLFHKFKSVPNIVVADVAVDWCVADKLEHYLESLFSSLFNVLFITCRANDHINWIATLAGHTFFMVKYITYCFRSMKTSFLNVITASTSQFCALFDVVLFLTWVCISR